METLGMQITKYADIRAHYDRALRAGEPRAGSYGKTSEMGIRAAGAARGAAVAPGARISNNA